MQAFIDTNIWLSFYHFSSDDLEQLKKIAVLISTGRLTLLLPEQVVTEWERNRDGKLADALKKFEEEKLSAAAPQMCMDYDEFKALRKTVEAYKHIKKELLEKLTQDIASESLKADEIIKELFAAASKIPRTPEILETARRRSELGNPPGIEGSLGDAINWESLLLLGADEDLVVVSADKHYISKTQKDQFSPFLGSEWKKEKSGTVQLFRTLSDFFRSNFPQVALATELEKELLIRELAESPSFAATRKTLRKLVQAVDFNDVQINDICDAVLENSQVHWIALDNDIGRYLRTIVSGRESALSPDKLEAFRYVLEHAKVRVVFAEMDDDEPPF